MPSRRILVTGALPYANGHIHLGHLVEYLQADIWVRFQKLQGHECRYFCADDTHGTAIMIRARQEEVSELQLIERMSAAHQRDFRGFGIEFDHYGSTHSDANRRLCGEVWGALRSAGLVHERDVTQLFDTAAGVFLADRFVKGTCPRCNAADQYGDNCDKCGATYSPTELQDAVSTLSGTTPELRTAPHLFVDVEQCHEFLAQWTQTGDHLQPEIANYLSGFFLNQPLREWDVSRPAPYFGFEIPDSPGNYWYVWFDAPLGYVASTEEWCEQNGQRLNDWWRSEATEIYHIIGKDIVYFHTLFWPSMLKTAGFSLPRRIQVHGFLTVNGEKMSKSKGTSITAATYLEHLDPEALRYYYASKLSSGPEDLDLDLDGFPQKVNSDVIGKVVNLASRTARFVQGSGLSASYPEDEGLFAAAAAAGDDIAQAYENFDYARAMRQIMALADRANEYVDRKQPWALKKQPGKEAEVQQVCTVCLNLYRQLMVYLAPVLPRLALKSSELLRAPIERWSDAQVPLVAQAIGPFKPLMQRVDPAGVAAVVAATTQAIGQDPGTVPANAATRTEAQDRAPRDALAAEPLAPQCTIDDFAKVDLRVARVVRAEHVPAARKLLKVTIDLGEPEPRTVFAGIKSAYAPEQLEGRLVVVVANLEPRKMKFGTSEGMLIAAGPGGQEIFLLAPDAGATPGQRIH